MSPDNSRHHDHDLKTLESKVDELIQLCQQFKNENNVLREHKSQLTAERGHLMEKNELARSRIEAMILRLKTLEQEYGQ